MKDVGVKTPDIIKDAMLAEGSLMSNAVDFLGQPLEVGNEVIFMKLNYRSMMKGFIKKITPKMVIIVRNELHWTNKDGEDIYRDVEYKQFHQQVVLMPKQIQT